MLRWGYDVKRVDNALAASLLSQHSERKRRKANLAKKLSLGSKVVGALSLYRYIPWGMNDNLLEFKRNPFVAPQETEARTNLVLQ